MGDEILMEEWRLYLTFFWTHEKAKEGRLAAKNRSLLTLQVLPISLAITRYQRSCFSKTEAVKVLWMAKSTILVTSAGGRTVQLEDARLLHMSWSSSWSVVGYVAEIRVLLENWIAARSFTTRPAVGILKLIFGSFFR